MTYLVEDVEVDGDEEHVVDEEQARRVEGGPLCHQARPQRHHQQVAGRQQQRRRVAVHQQPVGHTRVCTHNYDVIISKLQRLGGGVTAPNCPQVRMRPRDHSEGS